ncbi:mitochondrial carrier domain-containing protein, partial [Blyttiomyces helicus]
MSAAAAPAPAAPKSNFDLNKALNRALGGGLSGAAAMVVQVATLMPLRTTMNYQYRFGTTTTEAFRHLKADGGILRFYKGVGPALIQGPLSRFGDTAANAGILAFLDSSETTRNLPVAVKTIGASAASASFRMLLTPIDTLKTTMQTQGKDGIKILKARLAAHGVGTLWYGALASAAATFVGHYPWFAT